MDNRKFNLFSADNFNVLYKELNRLGLNKDDIVYINKDENQIIVIYYK